MGGNSENSFKCIEMTLKTGSSIFVEFISVPRKSSAAFSPFLCKRGTQRNRTGLIAILSVTFQFILITRRNPYVSWFMGQSISLLSKSRDLSIFLASILWVFFLNVTPKLQLFYLWKACICYLPEKYNFFQILWSVPDWLKWSWEKARIHFKGLQDFVRGKSIYTYRSSGIDSSVG